LPHLVELYEKHADQRDRFVILALHDTAAKTFAELDPKLEDLQKQAWNGKPLPFPILLDSTGQSLKDYGIEAFPTVVLIDPDGNVVRGGDADSLEKQLAKP
jgi:hypothetical protein